MNFDCVFLVGGGGAIRKNTHGNNSHENTIIMITKTEGRERHIKTWFEKLSEQKVKKWFWLNRKSESRDVVYFDQGRATPHAVPCSKSYLFPGRPLFYCMFLCGFLLFFLYFVSLVTEKIVLALKNWFRLGNGYGTPVCWSKYTT